MGLGAGGFALCFTISGCLKDCFPFGWDCSLPSASPIVHRLCWFVEVRVSPIQASLPAFGGSCHGNQTWMCAVLAAWWKGLFLSPLSVKTDLLNSPSFFPKLSVSSSIFLPFPIHLLLSYSVISIFSHFFLSLLLYVDLSFNILYLWKLHTEQHLIHLHSTKPLFLKVFLIPSSFSVNWKISQHQKCVSYLYIPCHRTSQISFSTLSTQTMHDWLSTANAKARKPGWRRHVWLYLNWSTGWALKHESGYSPEPEF